MTLELIIAVIRADGSLTAEAKDALCDWMREAYRRAVEGRK